MDNSERDRMVDEIIKEMISVISKQGGVLVFDDIGKDVIRHTIISTMETSFSIAHAHAAGMFMNMIGGLD